MRKLSMVFLSLLPLYIQAQESTSQNSDNVIIHEGIITKMLKDYDTPLAFYPYESNYLLYTYTSNINKTAISSYDWAANAHKDELKFQISLAFPVWRGIAGDNSLLGASYTQASWWQALNDTESSPFRETNYEPQVFLAWATDYATLGGWKAREIEIGFNHQSNGKAEPTSRSWNRGYARFMAQNGDWRVELKPWFRFSESASEDDNPDITKYLGYYRARIGYVLGESVFSLNSRYNWNSGYGSAELGWSYPINKHVRFYTQLFSGYGESMIDYNHRQTRLGVGVMLNDIM